MSFELQNFSLNIANGANWISLLKLWGFSIVVGIVISIVVYLLAALFTSVQLNLPIVAYVALGILFFCTAQIGMITGFEMLDGCYKKVDQ